MLLIVICSSLRQVDIVDWVKLEKRKASYWMCVCGRAGFFTPCMCGKKRTGEGMTEEQLRLRSFGMTVYPFSTFFGILQKIVREDFLVEPDQGLYQEMLDAGMVGVRDPPAGTNKFLVLPQAAAPGLHADLSVNRKTLVSALNVRSSFCRLYFILV